MFAVSAKPAVALALLAIFLQVAVSAMGGRLCCYQTPTGAASDSCGDQCCDVVQHDAAAENTPSDAPLCPGDSDCCIEYGREVFATSGVHNQVRDLDLVAPVLVPAVISQHLSGHFTHTPTASRTRTAHPPPSLAVVRTTVLLI